MASYPHCEHCVDPCPEEEVGHQVACPEDPDCPGAQPVPS